MKLLQKIKRITLFDKVQNSEIQNSTKNMNHLFSKVNDLSIYSFVKKNFSRMPQENLPIQGLLSQVNGKNPLPLDDSDLDELLRF